MLREQSIVKETLEYFSNLNYPKNKLHIYVVTTQREVKEKEDNYILVNDLVKDISKGLTTSVLFSKYGNLFPLADLELISGKLRGKSKAEIETEVWNLYKTMPTTNELAKQYADVINQRAKLSVIKVFDYTNPSGVMGHQINFLIDHLDENLQNRDSAFFAIYNADSRPNRSTLTSVNNAVLAFEKHTNYSPKVIQQSSLFEYANPIEKSFLIKSYLYSSSVFQSKWTLIHELSRLRYQSESTLKINPNDFKSLLKSRLSHCVGHGLFIRYDFLSASRIPTETVNEDLPYGFYQSCMGEPIVPIPMLEISDSPVSVKSLINQKRVWFWPYIEYWKCRNIMLKSKSFRSKFEVNFLAIQGIIVGLIWIMQSLIFIFPILIAIILANQYLLLIYLIAIFLYWVIPLIMICLFLRKLANLDSFYQPFLLKYRKQLITSLAFGLVVIWTHSIGPFLCVIDYINNKYFYAPIIKNKTNR